MLNRAVEFVVQVGCSKMHAAIGAVVGGAAGFATAYFTAIDTCYKQNPAWIPESKIERTKAYALAGTVHNDANVGYSVSGGTAAAASPGLGKGQMGVMVGLFHAF